MRAGMASHLNSVWTSHLPVAGWAATDWRRWIYLHRRISDEKPSAEYPLLSRGWKATEQSVDSDKSLLP